MAIRPIKLTSLSLVTLVAAILLVAFAFGVIRVWFSVHTMWLVSVFAGAVVLLVIALASGVAEGVSRVSRQLLRLVKLIAVCVLLTALVGFLVRLSTREGIAILAFDDETKEAKYNGKAIADSLQMELFRIQNILSAPRKSIESSERLIPMNFHQQGESLNESVKDIGTIGAGEAKISVGAVLMACKSFWPIGGARTTITGCVQRFGNLIRIVARIESHGAVQNYEVSGPLKTDDDLFGMIRQLAFRVAMALQDPSHPIAAKTAEAFQRFTDALECFDRFVINGDSTELDCSKANALAAFDCESDYKALFNLLTDIGVAYAEAKGYRAAAEVFGKAVLLEPANANAYNNLGLMLGRLQRTEEAREAFKKAKSLSEQTPAIIETYSINLGDAQYYANHFNEAEQSYEDALSQNRNSFAALLGLAQVCVTKVDYDGARRYLEQASTIDPKSPKPYLLLGDLLDAVSDYERARSEYQKAIAIDPENAEAFNGLGSTSLELGDLEAAIAYFQQSIDSADKFSSPHVGLGQTLRAKGDVDGAKEEYRRAWQLDPGDDAPHSALGDLLLERCLFNEAESEYHKAADLAPRSAMTYINLGNLFFAQGKDEEAWKQYAMAEKISPRNRDVLSCLGDWHLAKRDYEKAENKYSTALELAPKNPLLLVKLGDLYRSKGNLDKAKEKYAAAIDAAPQSPYAHAGFADVSYDSGDYVTAEKEYLLASDLAAGWCTPHVGLGNTYYATADLEDAELEYGRAVDLIPSLSSAHAYIGDIHRRRGDNDRAIAEYTEAAKNDPRDSYSRARLAALLLATGKAQEAKRHCETAYKLEPREYNTAFIAGGIALAQNQAQQAENIWKQALATGYNRNVDDKLDLFMILCGLNKSNDARQLLKDQILSLANPPIGLLLEKSELANSLPFKSVDRFSICRKLLAEALSEITRHPTGRESGKTADRLKPTSQAVKASEH